MSYCFCGDDGSNKMEAGCIVLFMCAQSRSQVGNASTILGFVGAPFTLASYIVEGGSSKNYTHIKHFAFSTPEVSLCYEIIFCSVDSLWKTCFKT